jgi:TonB family protein
MWIDDRGSVEWAEVHESSGNLDLDDIALTVFNEVVEFRPPRGPGGAQPMAVLISIGFPF